MITPLRILIAIAIQSLIATAEPVGICLHAYGPDAPADKIECFEFEKVERAGDNYRFFPRSDRSVVVNAYRYRGTIPYKANLAPTHPEFDKLLKLYEETARATPSTRVFLNHRILAMRAQAATKTPAVAETPEEDVSKVGIIITTPEGSVLNDCRAISIHGDEVTLMHSGGVTRVKIESLSDDEKNSLGFESLFENHLIKKQLKADDEEKMKKLKAINLAREEERKAMVKEIDGLRRFAGGLNRFEIKRALELSDYPDLRVEVFRSRKLLGIYEIVIENSLAILLTEATTFSSEGIAVLDIYWSDTYRAKLTNGFKEDIKVFTESEPKLATEYKEKLTKKIEEYRRKFPE